MKCIHWYLVLTYSSSFLVEHRSSTRVYHLTLFCAVLFILFHVLSYLLSNSAIFVHRQVSWGLLPFRFPCGIHSSALLATCPSGLLNMWPIQPQALCLISAFTVIHIKPSQVCQGCSCSNQWDSNLWSWCTICSQSRSRGTRHSCSAVIAGILR